MAKVLIKGGTVLSLDRAVGNLVGADVLIDDGIISEVGSSLRARSAEVVDAADTIVMPGFVDTHRHLWQSFIGDVDSASDTDISGHYLPDDIYAATLVGLLRALEAGITTVVDWCDPPGDAAHLDAALTAHADSGVRTVFVSSQAGATRSADTTLALRLPRPRRGGTGRGRGAMGRGPRSGTADSCPCRHRGGSGRRGCRAGSPRAARARRHVVPLHPPERCRLRRHRRVVDGGGAHRGERHGRRRGSTSRAAAHRSGHPAGPGRRRRAARPRRCLRPDAGRDLRAARHSFDLKLAGKGGIPNLLGTRDVIRYATVDGARVAGLADITGSLSPGKRADVIVLRADRPNIAPVNDPIGAVVWGMDTSNIDWVFVGGAALVENGELTADVASARALAMAAQRQVAAAGLPAGAGADQR